MNISLPHSWLKQFLITDASPKKISECLSLSGPSIEQLEKRGDDYIYHLEITTNRVDMMSILGIAREAAAILPQFGHQAKFKLPEKIIPENNSKPFPLKISVDDKLCPRFAAVVIKDVKINQSPQLISDNLEKSGIRSLNNVVDISNYLMRLYGQPVHTFDFDKIKEKMILRLSKKGEKITTLDGKNFTLPGGDIVIEDGSQRLIDLCGIMGAANSAVDENTKNVLLFVQTYSPTHVRSTSMILGQRSEAAQLFEKQLDPDQVLPVLLYGIQLFKQITGGTQDSKIIDLYPHPLKPRSVPVSLQLIKDRLGIEISSNLVETILQSLGFDGFPEVTVPSWRANDVTIAEDIVEEVARIYGYHRLPNNVMATTIPTNYPDTKFYLEQQVKHWLVGFGLNEIYTNSLVSAAIAEKSGYKLGEHLKIKNALSEDWQYLRRSILPSHNQLFKAFEIAHTYHPRTNQLPEERLELAISGFKDFSQLKGVVEALFSKLHLKVKADFTKDTALIDLNPVLKQARLYPNYRPISAYPPMIEDLTVTLPPQTIVGPVIDAIIDSHLLVTDVNLTKIYQHNFTFHLTYQSLTRQLSAKDVQPIRKNIIATLSRKFKAKLVGQL